VFSGLSPVVDADPPVEISNWKLWTPNKAFTWFTWVVEAGLLVTSTPPLLRLQGGFACDETGTGAAVNWLWLYTLLGTAVDGVTIIAADKFPQAVSNAGAAWVSGYGFLDIGTTFLAALRGNLTGPAIAANFCTTIPEFFKMLRIDKIVTSTKGGSLIALALIDIIFYEVAAFLTLYPLVTTAEPPLAATA
jgi:hypothetical protein